MGLHSPNFCFFVSAKSNARNINFNQRPIVRNKIISNSGNNCKTIYTVQELYLFSFSFLARVISANFTFSIVSVHSSIN